MEKIAENLQACYEIFLSLKLGSNGMKIPFLRPSPPRLSELLGDLIQIEKSGIFTNFGPMNTRLEGEATRRFFGGAGGCITVNNATIGLMLAMAEAVGGRASGRRYAVMPSFTFAATAQAAMWVGLTPLFCDVDPHTWLACPDSENALLEQYGDDIALIVPYATFGNNLDLGRYEKIVRERGVPVVVDAAASLGSIGADGFGFGYGSSFSIVFSMHATKTFATSEGGMIYSADEDRRNRLRAMANFGFSAPRNATMLGLNGKLSEVSALIALERLRSFDAIVEHRANLAKAYRDALKPVFGFQQARGRRLAYQFMPALLPAKSAGRRKDIIAELEEVGIGVASYFSPHLAEQSFFQNNCVAGDLPHTTAISRRILSLPMADIMTLGEVDRVVESLMRAVGHEATMGEEA